ncbi:MAG: hypothetical protein H7249_18605 [Chitinophagaceae bacterium]|nr:hypothetical protein [Oligoflexus sp.]
MQFLLNLSDIIGAVVSSKMTGDVRTHAGIVLKMFVVLTVIAYFVARS